MLWKHGLPEILVLAMNPALIEAIRKVELILLSDYAITEVVCDALDEGLDAQDCIDHSTSVS